MRTVYKQPQNIPVCSLIINFPFKRKSLISINKQTSIFTRRSEIHQSSCVYSDNAQMMSKCGQNKEVLYKPQANSMTYHTLTSSTCFYQSTNASTELKIKSICSFLLSLMQMISLILCVYSLTANSFRPIKTRCLQHPLHKLQYYCS